MTADEAADHIAQVYEIMGRISKPLLTRLIKLVGRDEIQSSHLRATSALAIREAELRAQARIIGRLRNQMAKRRRKKLRMTP